MKILIDMNLSTSWVETLAAAGIDATHWSRIGSGDSPDFEIMKYARAGNYVVLTRDLDFSIILASTRQKGPSVIQLRTDKASSRLIGRLVIEAMRGMSAELDEGALVTIDLKRTRLRVLPIR
jgi:predicted nuclease of predicted toxin-antitoxin system